MNTGNLKATQLDQMLYAWLAEPDERRFERAFQRYYAEASPSLIRYLARRSNLADLDCEQIAVDALLKFFCRAGRDRREAARSISQTLPQVEPLNLGPFHVRHVQRWRGEVDVFREGCMTFSLPTQEVAAQPWKAAIQAQNDGLPPLQRQGVHILDSVRSAVSGIADLASAPDASTNEAEESAIAAEAEDASPDAAVRAFAQGLREAAERGSPGSSTAESRHPGVVAFVGAAWTVLDVLPALRIPTNGYLFDIAQSLYLDECKSRARKKRGGGGSHGAPSEEGGMSPFALDEESSPGEDDSSPAGPQSGAFISSAEALGADPAAEQIDEDFCERFYEYLRKPLDDAQEAYHRAAAAGKGNAERKRLESVSEKHARLMSVLSMRIEGHTQEAIAESLGLTRNQVKYMTEHVQDAYQQFCAAALRMPSP
jgi:DNA-directed RNA polymerase specialized sigma24 family protein